MSSQPSSLEFWFDFSSPYSALATLRIESLAKQANLSIEWRPFLLGIIYKAQGVEQAPALANPAKGRYMWQDLARRAAKYGFSFKTPSHFPMNTVPASRIGFLAQSEDWCGDFSTAVFRAYFERDEDISDLATLSKVLDSINREPTTILEKIQNPEFKQAFKLQNQQALEKGLFGAPTIFVGDEMFWGDDRLNDAVEWSKSLR